MKILVTGGAGFIGSHLVDRLIDRGDDVLIVDDLSTGKAENIHPRARFLQMDVAQPEIREVVRQERPNGIVHLAAQVDIQVSLRDPMRDAQVNILGTLNLLEACRESAVNRMIVASSAAVYGDPLRLPIDEDHPLDPANCYGVSKHTPEHYLQVYRRLFGIAGVALRFANVYGPRQDANGEGGVVAIFCDRLCKGEAPSIFGNGEQTRDFVYVGDVADAIVTVLEADADRISESVYNVGTSRPLTVNDLFRTLCEATGADPNPHYLPPRPGDILHSYLDNRRLHEALNWVPRTELRAGLEQTVAFWRNDK
ncbi:NAD-dependent epimerase/dehydratase family protein [Heliobacterium chlorum]|uniref:NAD-dependent epimerase/dehydratase family protein n=1 Tax=Heliobacterium chlorum TaxID=2698 RepID=A0ABR7T381_HELCL|nr:NAD-dependent epimerase/dehydratase family protein [Heliobacterium chlorum]MBC9784478.1 NAD-dependent epimerase/dehydratase family protein [Heliobacterium chlorum]